MEISPPDAIKILQLDQLKPSDDGALVISYCDLPRLKALVKEAGLKNPAALGTALWEGTLSIETIPFLGEDTSTGRDTPRIPSVMHVARFDRKAFQDAARMSYETARSRRPKTEQQQQTNTVQR